VPLHRTSPYYARRRTRSAYIVKSCAIQTAPLRPCGSIFGWDLGMTHRTGVLVSSMTCRPFAYILTLDHRQRLGCRRCHACLANARQITVPLAAASRYVGTCWVDQRNSDCLVGVAGVYFSLQVDFPLIICHRNLTRVFQTTPISMISRIVPGQRCLLLPPIV
jgi:hypothetical protein